MSLNPFKAMKNIIVKDEPKPEKTPEEVFFEALDVFNEAWKAYDNSTSDLTRMRRLRPWIDWKDREIIFTEMEQRKAQPER